MADNSYTDLTDNHEYLDGVIKAQRHSLAHMVPYREVRIANFKAYGNTPSSFALAPLTLLYGPNSAGKSSVFHSLNLVKQISQSRSTAYRDVPFKGPIVDLGSYLSAVHKHDVRRDIEISIKIGDPSDYDKYACITLRIGTRKQVTAILGVRYKLDGADPNTYTKLDVEFELIDEEEASNRRRISKHSRKERRLEGQFIGRYYCRSAKDAEALAQYIVKYAGKSGELTQAEIKAFPNLTQDLAKAIYRCEFHSDGMLIDGANFEGLDGDASFLDFRRIRRMLSRLFDWGDIFRDILQSVSYLGPLRAMPQRIYTHGGGHGDSIADISMLDLFTRSPDSTLRRLNYWLERMDIPYTLGIRSFGDDISGTLSSIILTDKVAGTSVTATDVGFGISQVLPVILAGSCSGLIIVEQPEIHLHPKLQGELADFFIETCDPQKQWFIETHSESLMLRIQRRIREGKIPPGFVSVLYVEPGYEDGSKVRSLKLNKEGEFVDEWPGGFFEDKYEDIFGA